MDMKPVYELRDRLRAAVIAGTNLLSEDFRLKRACEAFKPLGTASPVFAKIGQMTDALLSPDCGNPQGALLDVLALADAVVCTLGNVEVAGEVEPAGVIDTEENAGSMIVNAPYSILKELLEALTTPGGGHCGYVCDTHKSHPELFRDYRVKYALVQALGASYADLVERWLAEEKDKTILPLLYRDFDPKGKKEMARRVRVIEAVAGADANDFYIKMLEGAQKEVRLELLHALRLEPGNVPLLLELSKTEKGKNRDKVFELLAGIQDERVCAYFRELAGKKPETVLTYLRNTTTDWAAELVAETCDKLLEKVGTLDTASKEEKQEVSCRLRDIVRAFFGKGGAHICECYRKLIAQKEGINRLLQKTWQKPKNDRERDILQYGVLQSCKYWYKAEGREIETALGKVLHHSLIVNPDPELQALAMELYQNGNSRKPNVKFLAAATTVKFSKDEDCAGWLEEQVTDKILFVPKFSKERMKAVTEAAAYVRWDTDREGYELFGAYIEIYYPDDKSVGRPIPLTYAEKIVEWLISHASEEVDEVLGYWIPLDNQAICQKMGVYFYGKALNAVDNRDYLDILRRCGWKNCKGLGIKIVMDRPDTNARILWNWMTSMPGGKDAIMEEARAICGLIKIGGLKANKLNIEEFEKMMEDWYRKQ